MTEYAKKGKNGGLFLTGLRVVFQRIKVSKDRIRLLVVLTPLGRWCTLHRTEKKEYNSSYNVLYVAQFGLS